MWFIWKERCNRVFENKSTTVKNLAMEIQGHVAFWAQRSNLQNKAKKLKKKTLKPLWQAPSKDTLKINVDAAWISDSLPSSYALILRDDTGISGGGKARQSATADPQESEALGVMQAAIWAYEKGLEKFNIEGDCKSIFKYLQGKAADISWCSRDYLDEANRLAHLCNNFLGFYFVPRLGNGVADTLAKFVRPLNTTVTWETTPPTCIIKQILVDKSNIIESSCGLILDGSTPFVPCIPLGP
ncbi:uncharacterized protein LOC113359545 [Papaver somniferum]|uniref:uncharacterized protein LOC113359545 n=1 Tax=Papaver somniferum TaxID=3469 RepID=UPI000E6F7C51|nr:uncharacterized protein LOC113359545 [Papaver somniferum]